MLPNANGSAIVDTTAHQMALSHLPGQRPFAVTVICYPDPRGAPNDGARLTSELTLAVLVLQQQIAELRQQLASVQIAVAEHGRPLAVEIVGAQEYPNDRARDGARAALALAAVASAADQIEINARPVASALDEVVPS